MRTCPARQPRGIVDQCAVPPLDEGVTYTRVDALEEQRLDRDDPGDDRKLDDTGSVHCCKKSLGAGVAGRARADGGRTLHCVGDREPAEGQTNRNDPGDDRQPYGADGL